MNRFYMSGIAAAAMLGAMPALAATNTNVKPTPLTGPYVGIYGGYDWTDPSITGGEPDGWDGGVFVGYKFDALLSREQDIGIGANGAIEFFYGVSNADDSSAGVTVDKKSEWGVSFRPGISILDAVTGDIGLNPYGIIGYRNTEFDVSGGPQSGSERFDGFELGIGTQLVAFGDAGVRLEYSHTWYGSEGGMDPSSDDVRLGLSYHF